MEKITIEFDTRFKNHTYATVNVILEGKLTEAETITKITEKLQHKRWIRLYDKRDY